MSGTHSFNPNIINNLIKQLPNPFILLGDLNSHSTNWGCKNTDNRGTIPEKIIRDKNLCILNNGAPTRIGYNSESAIDITICSAALTPLIDWSVSTSPGDSDHCPIQKKIMKQNTAHIAQTVSWNYKKADWLIFSNDKVWGNFLDVVMTPQRTVNFGSI